MSLISQGNDGPNTFPSSVFVSQDQASCTHVFIHRDHVRPPLMPAYDGLYRVLHRALTFTLDVNGREDVVAADRPKPAYIATALPEVEVIYRKTPTPIKHYMLAVVVIVAQQFSGVDLIIVYATGPMHARSRSTPYDELIVLAFVQLVMTAGAIQLLDRAGRVIPLAVSVTLCTATVLLGTVSYGMSSTAASPAGSWAFGLNFASKLKRLDPRGYDTNGYAFTY
ncbi:uncharacterized protein LOC144120118 [Amblyomma americanum]